MEKLRKRAPILTGATIFSTGTTALLGAGFFAALARTGDLRTPPEGSPEGAIAPMLDLMKAIDTDTNVTAPLGFAAWLGLLVSAALLYSLYRRSLRP